MTVRKTNLEAMSEESLDSLAAQVGEKISEILSAAKADCDKVLTRMGLTINLGYEIQLKSDNNNNKE